MYLYPIIAAIDLFMFITHRSQQQANIAEFAQHLTWKWFLFIYLSNEY